MDYSVSFGAVSRAPRTPSPGKKFRLAVLADFSGRANAGLLETGADLASRKPLKVDVDNLDTVIARMKLSLSLPVGPAGDAVQIDIEDMDAFHPDQLFEKVEIFEKLSDLRRRLSNRATFERAAKEVKSWSAPSAAAKPARRPKARGNAIPTDRKISDFARLVGTPTIASPTETAVDDLIRRVVGAHIVPAKDPKQDQLVAQVDAALSATMCSVLHHPDFQTLEATWRSVELLVRRLETGARLEIVLYDVSAEELAADVAATDTLEETGLYGMLAEQPMLDAAQGPLSAVIGLYAFELTPPHAELLGRIARIAAGAAAPFISAIGPDALKTPMHEQHELIQEAWSALYALPEAGWLGLVTPRFLLRMPYGKKTDPIDSFSFEEFTRAAGLGSMLYGNPAVLVGFLLAETFVRQGTKMKISSMMTVGEMPYYVYTDADGDQVALPCTERMYSERQAVQVTAFHVMPLLSLRGRPEVRLGSINALGGQPIAGFWAPPASIPDPVEEEEEPAAAAADEEPAEESDTEEPTESEDETTEADASGDSSSDDLDALLSSLNADAPAAEEGGTDADLDALLESLK